MTTPYIQLQERIAERARLKDEITATRNACETAGDDVREIAERLKDERNALAGIRPSDDPRQAGVNQSAIDRLQCELDEATARKKDLDAQLSTLKQDEHATLTASAEALTEHRAIVATAKALVGRLEALVDNCDTDQNNGFEDPRPALAEQRSDLLAAVAMGEASAADLAAFDKAHAAEVKAATAKAEQHATTRADTEAVRAGLLRKLDRARAEVARLEALTPAVRMAFLNTELEAAARTYAAASSAEAHAFGRLRGLQELLRRDGGPPVTNQPPLKAPPIDHCAAAEVERLSAAGVLLF